MKSIWIETIWTTQNCQPLISENINNFVYDYLKTEFIELGCEVKIINGFTDHVHCLFNLNPKRSLDEIIKMVKGASSHKINQNRLTTKAFVWEKGYDATSVGRCEMENKIQNILDQKKLHADHSFTVVHELIQMRGEESESQLHLPKIENLIRESFNTKLSTSLP